MKALFSKGESVRIAIIDDNSEMLRCLRITLVKIAKKLGVGRPQVIPLMDPHWVMKYYKNNPFPDVVLCDYLMPDMDGYEVYVALRDMGYKGEFIFVTGAEHILRDDHGDDLEETKIIAKPYSVEDFKDIVSAR